MEYPSKNDFYLKFKAIYDDRGIFSDYMLVASSNNIHIATGIKADNIIGQKISNIVIENENLFMLKEFYNFLIPGIRRKFEIYSANYDRYYLVNLFSDEKDYMLLVYNDISRIKKQIETSKHILTEENSYFNKVKLTRNYYKDELTGLYTREFFNQELERLDTSRMLPLSVIFADVNSLKLVNDAFGHNMGDELLKKVTSIMKKAFREEDIVARMGGDEFAILLPKTVEARALEIVASLKKEYVHNPLDYIALSVSFGVATKTKKDEDINEILKKADKRMYYMKIKENTDTKEYMIEHLKKKLEEISNESKADYDLQIELSFMMADFLKLDENSKEELRLLCEYHDIGKVGISKDILQKPTPLSSLEWEDLKRHSEIGYHITKGTKRNLAINDLILIHHERWDGNGYPGFLKGKEIPIVVRIFSIVDAYVAMINDRPYRRTLGKRQALNEIINNSGTQFDPDLVDVFMNVMKAKIA